MVKMSKEKVKAILGIVLLILQICLGLWQFFKLTPLGVLVKGVVGCFLRHLGLSPSYTHLEYLPGRIFKTVPYVYVWEDQNISPVRPVYDNDVIEALPYLGRKYSLKRTGDHRNMLHVDEKMSYYITPKIWHELGHIAGLLTANLGKSNVVPNSVFLENYKEIWEDVATGRATTIEQVLDHIILDCHTLRRVPGSSKLLPVDLSVSEERILKILNFAGFVLQTKEVYWLIPLLLSLISTVLEFCTPLRIWIYEKINLLFCRIMHRICDPLPRSMRSYIYLGLGKYLENLKPTNDIRLKVTKGSITATIAGGAKVHTEDALIPVDLLEEEGRQKNFSEPNIDIRCVFNPAPPFGCEIRATAFDVRVTTPVGPVTGDVPATPPVGLATGDVPATRPVRPATPPVRPTTGDVPATPPVRPAIPFTVQCSTRDHFCRILTLVSSIATNGSGSLKSYGSHGKVCVRGLKETLVTYVASGFPDVYEMKLVNVVVN